MLGSSQKRPVTRSSVPNVHSPSLGPSGSPEGDAPLSSPRRESKVNSSLGLPSPREYRHEVKELLAVGDKVWTADRRTPKIAIRSVETGDIEKELRPPNTQDPDEKNKTKEHIFPWSMIHVRFPIVTVLQPDDSDSSSGRRPPPQKNSAPEEPMKKELISYVDEVWVGYSNGTIRVFNAITGAFITDMREAGGIYTMLQWGDCVYSGSNDWTIRKWDANKKLVIGQFLPGESGHSNSVRSLIIADKCLASASDDFTIRLWDHALVGMDAFSTTGRCLRVMRKHSASVTTLCWVEKRLWSGSEDATVMVWDIETGSVLKTFKDTRHVVTRLVALPKIHRVMCCSVDNVVRVYDARTVDLVSELEGHTGFVHSCAAIATELRYVVWSSSQDATLRVWSVAGDGNPESTSKFCKDMDDADEAHWLRWKLMEGEAKQDALRRELDELRAKVLAANDESAANLKNLRQLEHENNEQADELVQLRTRVSELEDELNTLRARDSDNTQLINSLNSELADKNSENMQLTHRLHDLERTGTLTERDRARDDADRLQKMVNDMGRVIKDLQHDFGDAKSLSNLEKDTREAIRVEPDALHRDAKSKVSDLRAALAAKAAEAAKVPHLQSQLSDKDSQISALENELTGCKNRLMSAEHELAELRRAIEDNVSLRRNNSDLENALRLSNLERDRASNELDQLKSKYETLKNAHDILADRFNARDEENRRLGRVEDQLKFLEDELLRVKGELATALTDIERLTREKADLEQNDDRSAREALDKESENRRLRQELDALKQAVDELMRERDALQADKTTWGDRMKAIQKEIENREARVARTEEVLSGMRAEATEMEDLIRQLREREKELAAELASLQNERIKNADLENTIAQLQAEHNADSEHYAFILRSRTDFIQAVYDWLLCSAMSRRCAKKSDLTVAGAMDALVSAVEGAYKRGHYILSNYVSELEK
eukprot:gene11569-17819_t